MKLIRKIELPWLAWKLNEASSLPPISIWKMEVVARVQRQLLKVV